MQYRRVFRDDESAPPRIWKACIAALFVVTIFSIAFGFKLPEAKMSDPFHFGEYFVSSISLFGKEPNPQSVTIHGALDYIPDNISKLIYGNEANFFPTWLAYRLLDLVAQCLLIGVFACILRNAPRRTIILMATAMTIPFMVGYRDVVLILSILLFFIARSAPAAGKVAWEASFGVVAAFGVFWSFDRGLAGTASLGLACLAGAVVGRRNITALLSFVVAAAALSILVPEFSFSAYWTNFRFLMATSSNWNYGWLRDPAILIACLLMVYAYVYSLYIPVLRNPSARTIHLEQLVFLLIFGVLELKLSTNRADLQHILMGSWAPLVLAVYWYAHLRPVPVDHQYHRLGMLLVSCILLFITAKYRTVALVPVLIVLAACLLQMTERSRKFPALKHSLRYALLIPAVAAIFSIISGARNGNYQWVHYLGNPPSNWSVALEGNAWAAKQLIESGASCVLDFSNNGIINGLANLPSCTRFPYVAYADSHYEAEMLSALENKKPAAVVYSAQRGHFIIDKISMHEKFPQVTTYINKNYPVEVCEAGFCVRKLAGAQ